MATVYAPGSNKNTAGNDPFEAMGGGVLLPNGGWVDRNNPAAQPYLNGGGAPAPANSGTGGGGGNQGAQTPDQQAAQASTYSSTPGAAPTQNTTNQGTQDVVRNTYLQQATQPATVSENDPIIKNQVDAFRAETDRARTQYLNEQAESAGPYATGALRGQERATAEAAGQQVGSYKAQLMANELLQKRQEIQNALSSLGGLVTTDQARALQQQLADLDAQLKTLGITTAAGTADKQLAVQQALGIGGLNLGLLQALLGNQQFNDQLGLNTGIAEANFNQKALPFPTGS